MTTPTLPDDEQLISADSHVALGHGDVRSRLPGRLRSAYDDAVEAQAAELAELRGGQTMSLASFGDYEARRSPGYRDAHARLADMDRDGVRAEVLYSELSAFRLFHLAPAGWREISRAFNDALADFASADPDRLVPAYQLPIVDIGHAVREVRRLAELGARTVQLPTHPTEIGFPDWYDDRYDPLWSALADADIAVSQHLGLPLSLYDVFRRDPTPQHGVFTSLAPMSLAETIGMWILPGVLERHPRLRVLLVEPGLTWVPFYLDTLDTEARGPWDFPALKELPSTYFRRQMALSFVEDARGLAARHELGVENLMWSTDYPHPQTSWPNSRAVVARQFAGIPDDERRAITYGNAARVFRLAS